ncbi:hypothetical protein HA466_0175120 [Hirschfeldia incana]|nr:hypothetical protein HA466_0175120 [Hirschfeldia incana]
MRHEYFGDVSSMEEKLQMYTNQFESQDLFNARKFGSWRLFGHVYTREIWIFTGMIGRRLLREYKQQKN